LPSKSITSIVYKRYNEKTVTFEDDGTKLFFNYIGLFLLIMTIWIWRKELNINQFGFIGGNDIEPTDPVAFQKLPTQDPTSGKIETSDKEINKTTDFESYEAKELKNKLIANFMEMQYGLTNVKILASKYGVSTHIIQRILFELMKENIVRRDTYPGSGKANFSYSASIENRAIDDYAKHLKIEILSDNRFVRISQRYEVDAIIRTSLMNYVIEVKILDNFVTKRVDEAVKRLLAVEEHIKLSPLKMILIIATKKKFKMQLLEVYQNIENLTIYLYEYAD
jgi:DNA-binding transcriptional regulator YhcF (GntR family)